MASAVSKVKRVSTVTQSVPVKAPTRAPLKSTAAPAARTEQPNALVLKTDWNTLPPALLHSYRTFYRLPTPSAYTHIHADLIYNSSRTALRTPSAVLARRRLRDIKHQRRKAVALDVSQRNAAIHGRIKGKEKGEDTTDQATPPLEGLNPQSLEGTSNPTAQSSISISNSASLPTPQIPAEQIGKTTTAALATAVRKHFNAQQLTEPEAIARFTYVVRQHRSRVTMSVEGGGGDGMGCWIGSRGREVRRGFGGEVGFRLRFS